MRKCAPKHFSVDLACSTPRVVVSIHRRLGRSLFPCCVEQVRLVRLIISLLGGEPCGTVTQKSG